MLELSKKLGICIGVAATLCMAACGDDDSSGDKGQGGNEQSAACESNDDCKNVEGKPVCNPEKKECEAEASGEGQGGEGGEGQGGEGQGGEGQGGEGQGGEGEGQGGTTCTGTTIDCNGTCVDKQTDMNNCGACGNICVADSQECKDGSCVDKVDENAECQDSMQATCDEENNIVTCSGGKYQKSPCDGVCKEGKCEAKEAAECDASEGKSCAGNKVKSCSAKGKYEYKDCGDKACDEVTLDCSTESFQAECTDADAASCTEANETKKCDNGKWDIKSCGNFKCDKGECSEELVQAECESDYKATCTDDGKLKTCADGKFKTEDCPNDPVETECKADEENGASCAPKAAQCPDDYAGDKTADTDGDGVLDCLDVCPDKAYKSIDDGCGSCDKLKIAFGSKEFCATPIQTAKEFIDIRDDIIAGKRTNTQNDAYALINDIDFGFGDDKVFRTGKHEWSSVLEFKGVLVSIGNKTISYTTDGTTLGTLECEGTNGCGLFNRLNSARIGDIKLNFNVKGKDGVSYTGALAGYATASTLKNVSVSGKTEGNGTYVGGVIGYLNQSAVTDVSHDGEVSTTGIQYTGGLFGRAISSTLSGLKSKGKVTANRAYIGGIFGRVESCTIADLEADCTVEDIPDIDPSTNRNNHNSIAGIIGGSSASTTVTNAVAKGSIKGSRQVGGIFGAHSGNSKNLTNNAQITIVNETNDAYAYAGGIVGNLGGGYIHENIINNGDISCDSSIGNRCRRVAGCYGDIETAPTTLKNVINKGNVTIIKNGTNNGGIAGDAYNTSFENVINEGDINCITTCGGIAGYLTPYTTYSQLSVDQTDDALWKYTYGNLVTAPITVNNVVNKGVVNSTSSDVGGIFGFIRFYKDTKWEGLFNLGEVTGTTYVGGLIGRIYINDDFIIGDENKKLEQNLTIDKSYNAGEVNGSDQVGGLAGRIETRQINRYFDKTDNYRRARCTTNTGTYTNWWRYRYADVDTTIRFVNSYAGGLVSGSSNVGALVGYLYNNNETVNVTPHTVYSYSTDGSCTRSSAGETQDQYTRTGRLVIENSYASASVEVIGANSSCAGMIGYVWSANGAGSSVKHSLHNVYTTSPLSVSSGKVIGGFNNNTDTPALMEFKNAYYWDQSGAGKIVGNGATITGVTAFNYTDKVPMVGEDSLLNVLLDNMDKVKDAKGTKDALEWKDKDVKIGAADKTIPSFDFAPVDWQSNNSSEQGSEQDDKQDGR